MLAEQQQPCSQDGTLTVRNGPTVTAPCRIFPKCSSTYPQLHCKFDFSRCPIICFTDPDQAQTLQSSAVLSRISPSWSQHQPTNGARQPWARSVRPHHCLPLLKVQLCRKETKPPHRVDHLGSASHHPKILTQ